MKTAETSSGPRRRTSGLFRRIYSTFIVTVLASAIAAGIGAYLLARGLSADWVGDALQLLADRNDALVEALDDPDRLQSELAEIERELHTGLVVYDERGEKITGQGPRHIPRRARHHVRHLRRGRPLVRRPSNVAPALVLVPLVHPDTGGVVALVHARAPRRTPAIPIIVSAGLMLTFLAVGAWILSRSMTGRLADLERSAGRIAGGDLGHRVEVPVEAADEIDELGHGFNEMAQKVQTLVVGQQTLLTNVSHELRTPIARVKVLLEILEERAHALQRLATGDASVHLQRLIEGLTELTQDTAEIEALIADLLTSGRLELRQGRGDALDRSDVDLRDLLVGVADRFDADADAPTDLVISADALLLERLLTNLLANARRACPTKPISIEAQQQEDTVEIVVQDEGPGVEPNMREVIFEPFTRLDHARSRDKGGVGLGLYLCRQICVAHGGSIHVEDRPDGKTGARFVIDLPKT